MLARPARAVLSVLTLVLALGVAGDDGTGAGGTGAGGKTRFLGLSLTEALLALQDGGLKIAFTSHLVRPQMRVLEEPSATAPSEILAELLRPHGLKAQTTPEGLYVVVPGPTPKTGLDGQVLAGQLAVPLGGVRILIPDLNLQTVSDVDGQFTFDDLKPGTYAVEAHLPGFVVGQQPHVVVAAGRQNEVNFRLESAPIPLDEIVVTPSQVSLLKNDPVSTLAFSRDEILALPHLGDDLFRALTILPGISGNERSAEFSIRGGRPDEVLVILDDLELFEPFHLKDFGNATSIIAPRAIGELDLIVGAFPAEYGDRMGGVLEMSTETPTENLRSHVGLALLSAQAGSAGNFGQDSGQDGDGQNGGNWLVLARRGGTELAQNYLDEEERPRYWDAFGKVQRHFGERHEIGARLLHADDDLDIFVPDDEGDTVRTLTGYGNSYFWLTHQSILGDRLFVDSAVSVGRVHRDRRSAETSEPDEDGESEGFSIVDQRDLDVVGFKQAWNFAPGNPDVSGRQYVKWGFDLRRLDTEYDYLSVRELEDTLDDIRTDPRSGTTEFRRRFESNQIGLYAADRIRPGKSLTLELGLRYDEQSITGDRNFSPRFNLVWALGQSSTLRAAWGHYFQTQRIYELQVEDNNTDFSPAELTEAVSFGFEHIFKNGMLVRLNGYRRSISNPRTRYENVIEPVSSFPEIEPDRVRIDADSSKSQGIEVFVRGRSGRKVDWWASYAHARTTDQIDGRRVPRGIDQPHTFNIDFSFKANPNWTIHLAWRYHTGWPTTMVSGLLVDEDEDEGEDEGDPVLIFGPLNAERLPDYHRLDLRASRRWTLKKRGTLTFYLELQNLYDRGNLAGFDVDYEVEITPDGQVQVTPIEETWGGLLPSFGFDWEF